MDFKHLSVFVTIADTGTLTAASEELHIAQSALSRYLQSIEEEYGAQLMRRGARKIQLTDEGQILYKYAKDTLMMSESIHQEIHDRSQGLSGTLRIGTVPNLFALWMSSIFPAFHAKFPKVKYEIYEESSNALIKKLQDGLCDIAILRTPVNDPDLDVFFVGPDPLTVSYRGDSFFQGCGNKVRLDQLEGVPLFISRWWYRLFHPLCLANGFTPNIVALSDRITTNLMWAENLEGCAVVPVRTIKQFAPPDFHYKIIDEPALTNGNAIATVKGRYLPVVAQNFLEMLLPLL